MEAVKNENIYLKTKKMISVITSFFIIITLVVFPLFYNNYYFDMLKAKYTFYYISVLIMIGLVISVVLVFAVIDMRKYDGTHVKYCFAGFKPKTLWKNLTAAERMLFLFLLFAVISTIQSEYLYESFWGNEGRFSGLFLILLYVVSVFLIGKFGHIKKVYLDLFIFAGILACLFGITDYFKMDILHFKVNLSNSDKDSFTSTFGNINTYTAYVALFLGTAAGLFATEKKPIRLIYYGFAVLVGFFAIITGQSDNAYLALAALFGLLPLILFGSRTGIKRYVVLAAGFITIMKWIAIINSAMPEKVIGLSGLFAFLTESDKLTYIVIALWLLVVVIYMGDFFTKKRETAKEKNGDQVGNWLRVTWLILLGAGLAAVCFILYDANFGTHPERYESLSRYLIFNDTWGTNRGYCWRIGWESYMAQPLMHKLFGFGPDTFGILTWGFRQEAIQNYGVFFESAHNEYFQYLVTMGPFTLFFYVAFLFTSCKQMVKTFSKNPWVLAPLAAVVCYGAQALVNINVPIATPIMWTLLAVGIAISRQEVEAG